MRTFTHGSGSDRKVVAIEVKGARMRMLQKASDGTMKRSEKELRSESEAQAACEKMARELVSRGFVEQSTSGGTTPKPAPKPRPVAQSVPADEPNAYGVFDEEDLTPAAEPVLPRMSAPASAGPKGDAEPKAKAKDKGKDKKKKKKKKKAGSEDALDKRVIAAVAAVGLLVVGFIGYVAYDTFLKPPTLIGYWSGTNTDFEIGHAIIRSAYKLSLDEKKNAVLTIGEDNPITSTGTYTVKGNRLKLKLKDKAEEGEEEPSEYEREFKIALGRTSLDLYDPSSGKHLVQLIRYSQKPTTGGAGGSPKEAAGKDLTVGNVGEGDKDADAALASVEFSPKDGAFRVRYPPGWEHETGSRPDNTWSWAKFTKGSAQIHVIADIAGSLMAGPSNAGQHEEGSELAPVHNAHVMGKRTASEEYSDYQEGKPTLFKGAGLGEGRISAFTASTGGLLGSKVRGYRVTLLTNDRRVTVLCHCKVAELGKLKPTFLAVCRSLSR